MKVSFFLFHPLSTVPLGRLWRVKIVNRDEEIRFVETDFVLGCDGGSSDVRHIMGIPFRGSSYTSQKWFVIDATIDEDLQQNLDLGRTSVHPSSAFTAAPRRDGHAQVVPQFQFICDPKRSGAQMALANGHYRWEFIALPDPHRAEKLETDEYLSRPEVLMKLLKTRGILHNRRIYMVVKKVKKIGITEEVFKTHIHPNIIRTVIYTFQSRSAEKWGLRCESTSSSTGNAKNTTSSRGGGVFLLGDAAHLLPPFTGQGMCAGIRDAFNISWKIHYVVNNKASPSILDSYEIERRSHVDRVRRMSVLLGSLIMTRNPTFARMRDWLAYTLQSSKAIVSFINGNDIFRPLTYFWDGLLGSDFVEDSRHWLTRTLRSWQTALLLRFSPVGDIFIQPKVHVLTPERNHHHCKDRVMQELPLDEVLARDGRFSMVVRVRDGDNATHPEELLGPDSLRFWKGLGLKVVMVVDSPKQVRTQPERAEDTNGIESVWVQDIQGHVRTYCSSHNCEIALVRPDRIVFAVLAMDARQLNNLSTEVAQSLTSPSCHAVWRSASKKRNGQLWQLFLHVFLLTLLLFILF